MTALQSTWGSCSSGWSLALPIRKKESMTTLTSLLSSPTEVCSVPPFLLLGLSSIARLNNAKNSKPCLLLPSKSSSRVHRCGRILQSGSPQIQEGISSRSGGLFHVGIGDTYHEVCHIRCSVSNDMGSDRSSSSDSASPATTEAEEHKHSLSESQAMLSKFAIEVSSLDGALGDFPATNMNPRASRCRRGLVNKQETVMKLVAVTSVLGLQVCARAWAGPEVAQIILSPSFNLGDFNDIQSGFASAFLLIFISEIGDKTFFIAALLATRKSSIAVFSGTFGALTIMTVISVFLGRIFHYIDGILPSFGDTKLPVDDIAAVILLTYFGVSTLLEAASMVKTESGEEQQEAELAIAGVGAGGAVAGTVAATFVLVFVAEWGDKSFFSTIALAAASSPLGVVIGAVVGHGAATLLAVLGGSFLGNYVSEKVIAYTGGVLFLVFAGIALVEIFN